MGARRESPAPFSRPASRPAVSSFRLPEFRRRNQNKTATRRQRSAFALWNPAFPCEGRRGNRPAYEPCFAQGGCGPIRRSRVREAARSPSSKRPLEWRPLEWRMPRGARSRGRAIPRPQGDHRQNGITGDIPLRESGVVIGDTPLLSLFLEYSASFPQVLTAFGTFAFRIESVFVDVSLLLISILCQKINLISPWRKRWLFESLRTENISD